MLEDEQLKDTAKVNNIDSFKFIYDEKITDALIEGWDQNQKFYILLLDNEGIRNEVMGFFLKEIYQSLKKE